MPPVRRAAWRAVANRAARVTVGTAGRGGWAMGWFGSIGAAAAVGSRPTVGEAGSRRRGADHGVSDRRVESVRLRRASRAVAVGAGDPPDGCPRCGSGTHVGPAELMGWAFLQDVSSSARGTFLSLLFRDEIFFQSSTDHKSTPKAN